MPNVIPISDLAVQSRYRAGDILAFYGRDWRSRAIELATWGPSHVGIIVEWPFPNGRGGWDIELVLLESTMLCSRECVIQGKKIDGVQAQWPRLRIQDYAGRAKIFRLADDCALNNDTSDRLTELAEHWLGKPYDFKGALWSGTRLLKYLPRIPYNDLGSLFCSELIARCLQRIQLLCITNSGKYNPASLIRQLVESGAYKPGVPA